MPIASKTARLRTIVSWLCIWALPGLLAGGQISLFARDLEWWQCLLVGLRDWYLWMLLWPAILWLVNRFPLERNTWWRNFPMHVAAAFTLVVLYSAAHLALGGLLRELMGTDIWPRWPPQSGPADLNPVERLAMSLRFRGYLHLLAYLVLVSVAFAISYYRRYQERQRQAVELEAKLAEARLLALRMQLNPHFLFNALNAIASQVYDHPAAADEMIGNLSQLLRLSLDSSREQVVPLRRELEILELYLDLEKVRYGDRLTVEKEIEPAALDVPVPTLILQPLVENAIKHGLERSTQPGRIVLRARRDNARLRLEVTDNGYGLPTDGTAPVEGVGLTNTRARLRELYGAEQSLALRSAPAGGVVAELTLPWRAAG